VDAVPLKASLFKTGAKFLWYYKSNNELIHLTS
jgi:hypothetical protein